MGRKDREEAYQEEIAKIRLPKDDEVLGIVERMLGYDRADVRCADGKIRRCRIKGKLKKRVWIREGDVVLVKPWPVQGDERGDIIGVYTRTQAEWLREKGYLKGLFEEVF